MERTRSKRRSRKRHQQLEMDAVVRKRDKNGQLRGGKRPGAGRKPKDPKRPSSKHKTRPEVDPRHPQHVTLRMLDSVPHLRNAKMYAAIKLALVVIAMRENFRIVHHSVQGNHIHLIVEGSDKIAIWQGIRAFEISAARRIN